MKLLLRYVRMELSRNLWNRRFLLCTFCIVTCCVFVDWSMIKNLIQTGKNERMYLYTYIINFQSWIIPLLIFFASFSSCCSFCYDCEKRYYLPLVLSGHKESYIWGKVIGNVITTFLAMFLGLSIFCLLLRIIFPGNSDQTLAGNLAYDWSTYHNNEWMYFFVHNLLLSVATTFWSTIGLLISSYIPDVFITCTSPCVINYMIERYCMIFMPDILNTDILSRGIPLEEFRLPYNVIYACCLFLAFIVLFGIIFSYRVHRRIQNGIT